MEQQLVRCGVPSVRLYEHLAISSPAAAAAAAALSVQQQQHDGSQHPAHPLPPWMPPSTTLLYSGVTQNHNSRGGTPSAYPASPTFPYPVSLPWPWQPPVTMISRRSSPSSATASPGVRYAPYPRPASTPPPLRARPSTPN